MLQVSDMLLPPTQSFPPCFGAGLLQYRVLSRWPTPQVTEQSEKELHGPQAPSTGKWNCNQGEWSTSLNDVIAVNMYKFRIVVQWLTLSCTH